MSKRQLAALCFMPLLLLAGQASAQEAPWRIGRWNADSFGNQRVVLRVEDLGSGRAVRALIPWRRRDAQPELKRLIVTDDQNRRIANTLVLSVRRDSGDVLFEPVRGAGQYFLYYLPYVGSVRSNYPKVTYPKPDSTAAADWAAAARGNPASLPRARVVAFEAADSLSQRWPMQVIAMPSEIITRNYTVPGQPFVVFVEDRTNPIQMRDDLPLAWGMRAPGAHIVGPAQRDEYYSFQLGIWGLSSADSVRVRFAPFVGAGRAVIPASAFNCVTTDGIDWMGRPFHRDLKVEAEKTTPVWCGVMVPRITEPGSYNGSVTVWHVGDNEHEVTVPLVLNVAATVAVNHGDDEPWRLSRLRWLNSQLAADGEPTPPYTPVRAVPGGFTILGRGIQLDAVGFPRQITSLFTPQLTLGLRSHRLLATPFVLQIEGADGKVGQWHGSGVRMISAKTSRAQFAAHGTAGALDLDVHGTLDFDGNIEYRVALIARRDTAMRDVNLHMTLSNKVRYFMGMNQPGGMIGRAVPDVFRWKWDVAHNQDAFWAGDVDGGLQVTLKDDKYVRPLNTNFYLQSPLRMPRSWANDGKGTCDFATNEGGYYANCGSGPRTLAANDTLWFNFRVLVTPFHAVDSKTHFSTRYMHAYKPVDTARAVGANLVNVHHATAINPFINYPFLRPNEMKAYADSLHAAGMRFKIYYTVRELTDHAPEIWALRSLGTEVLAGGPGGGHSWLQENMVDNYLPGWYVPDRRDVAMVTSGISRWHNFYVEGMRWLTEHAGVDGIYLDDVAFDRTTMQRIRRVLTSHGTPGERIDLHSANQFNKNDGFASSANLYMEHFPYIDRLWFGEYFNYDSPPDYWLVELSGLPFGLMGEMLEKGGNPWRGMLFGMTNRLPWTGGDPRELWKAWDAFGIDDAKMRGWWEYSTAPVHTGERDVLATTYVRPGRSLVAIASWAPDTVAVSLDINWRALGLDRAHVRITAPEIPGFQPARTFAAGEKIPVAPGKGWLLRLDTFDLPARSR